MELAKIFAKVVAKILRTAYPFHSRLIILIFQCKPLPAILSGDVRLKLFNKFLIENYLKLGHPMIDDAAAALQLLADSSRMRCPISYYSILLFELNRCIGRFIDLLIDSGLIKLPFWKFGIFDWNCQSRFGLISWIQYC